jgi:hypothetical protein
MARGEYGKRGMKKAISIIAISLAACAFASALEAKSGRIKMVVAESNARLSVYYLKDPAKNQYVALFYDQDPRTSFISLQLDSKVYKLGDSSDFRFSVSAIATGIQVEFKSSICVVRQKIEFAFSPGAPTADGVAISFEIENVSERDISVGLRFLIDTYLGEKGGEHFKTDVKSRVSEETMILPSSADRYFVSEGDGSAFMCMLKGTGVTTPDSAIFANWKRINDSPWTVEVSSTRNFTQLPYSINDSAAALYYEPTLVSRGGKRKIALAFGNFSPSGFSTSSQAALTQETSGAVSAVTSSGASTTAASVQTDIAVLRDLIKRIDELLAAGGEVSEATLAEIRAILDAIEGHKNGY